MRDTCHPARGIAADSRLTQYKKRFSDLGYIIEENETVSSSDETLLFLNSTIALHKDQIRVGAVVPKSATVQVCLRHNVDEDSLSTFHMFGITGMQCDLSEAYCEFWNYLTTDCQMPPSSLYCVVHKDDKDLQQLWLKYSDEKHLRYTDENDSQYTTRWRYGDGYGFTGRGCTFVHILQEKQKCGENCGLFCNCRRHIQFGNVILINQGDHIYMDFGFGFERMLSCQYDHDIFSIPYFKSRLEYLMTLLKCERTVGIKLLKTIDNIEIMYSSGMLPGNHKSSYLMKKDTRIVFCILFEIGITGRCALDYLRNIFTICNNRYVADFMVEEYQKYRINMSKNIASARNWLASYRGADSDIYHLLYDQFGIPYPMAKKIVETIGNENYRIELGI